MVGIFSRNRAAGFCASMLVFGAVSSGAEAQYKEKILYSFTGGTDGDGPGGSLIADAQGNLYGTTSLGGRGDCGDVGCGTVFRLTPKGKEAVLYAFSGGSDGGNPNGGLIADAEGNLFGTTFSGGRNSCFDYCGTVFEVTPKGKETVLYTFTGGSDGSAPFGGLVADSQGNFYGTTFYGTTNFVYGTTAPGGIGCCGTVFELTPKGMETVLYSFLRPGDGRPDARLIADSQGNLYGTTQSGKRNCNHYNCGTVFEIAGQNSKKRTVLYSFADKEDGANPLGVIVDAEGNLYGVTESGGNHRCDRIGCGTVFEVTPQGTKNVLHTFRGGKDGAYPDGALLANAQGDLYGTTGGGGSPDQGTVFEVTPQGTETVVYAFKGGDDGVYPAGGLIADAQGNLYGTTEAGGTSGKGTVFEIEKK